MTNIAQLPQIQGSFAITTNSDWRDTLQFTWPVGSTNAGDPLDITGIDFFAQVRSTPNDPQPLLDCSTINGLIVIDGQLGTVSFAVPKTAPAGSANSAQTATLPISPSAVTDIIARGLDANGVLQTINLNQTAGPMTVAISTGVTQLQ